MKFTSRNIIDVILILGIVIMLLALWNYTAILKTDSGKCTLNPIIYGVQKLQEANNDVVTCQCTKASPSSPIMYVTNQSIEVIYPKGVVTNAWEDVNLSGFSLDG